VENLLAFWLLRRSQKRLLGKKKPLARSGKHRYVTWGKQKANEQGNGES
jgi:hypothetical protein